MFFIYKIHKTCYNVVPGDVVETPVMSLEDSVAFSKKVPVIRLLTHTDSKLC